MQSEAPGLQCAVMSDQHAKLRIAGAQQRAPPQPAAARRPLDCWLLGLGASMGAPIGLLQP